ncbi:MAG: hypothetical protein K2J98_02730, partial [Malacoplasma sp.]|nr:hypothetical protein [Malacoplasma sp.]
MKKENLNEKIIQPPSENNLAQVKNENLILDKKENHASKPLEEVELKQNTKTFGKNPPEVKEVQIISFKESLKKNFNLQRYEKMETNIAWVK